MDSVSRFGNSTNKERTQQSYNNNKKKGNTHQRHLFDTQRPSGLRIIPLIFCTTVFTLPEENRIKLNELDGFRHFGL